MTPRHVYTDRLVKIKQDERIMQFYTNYVKGMKPTHEIVVSFRSPRKSMMRHRICWDWRDVSDAKRLTGAFLHRLSKRLGGGKPIKAFVVFEQEDKRGDKVALHCHMQISVPICHHSRIDWVTRQFWNKAGMKINKEMFGSYIKPLSQDCERYTRYMLKNYNSNDEHIMIISATGPC